MGKYDKKNWNKILLTPASLLWRVNFSVTQCQVFSLVSLAGIVYGHLSAPYDSRAEHGNDFTWFIILPDMRYTTFGSVDYSSFDSVLTVGLFADRTSSGVRRDAMTDGTRAHLFREVGIGPGCTMCAPRTATATIIIKIIWIAVKLHNNNPRGSD